MTSKNKSWMNSRWGRGCGLAALCAMLAACGGNPPANDAAPATASGAAAKTPASNEAATAQKAAASAPKFLSVFSTNDARDPFFPRVKPKTANVNTPINTQSATDELIRALSQGFTGTYGTAEERMALVHGVLLLEKRESVISVPMGGGARRVKVKPVSILRNTVELQVEGIPQTVTITPQR